MKKIYKLLSVAGMMSLMVSCDYLRINTNPFEMTEEEGKMDGVALGAAVTLMERCVFPVGTQADRTDYINAYQTAYMLSVDGWSGYFGQDNNWYSGNNPLTYYLQDDWGASTYKESYTQILPSWKKVRQQAEKNGTPEVFALAQILKISAWHKTLETFGPIPYIHAGEMAVVIPFDSEKEVYEAMFNDLKDAVETLRPLAETGGSIMANYDIVYGGSASKWVKYANSLMLRLAMRLKYVDADMSKKWAMEAYGNDINNLMNDKSDEAQVSTGAGYVFINNINHCATSYNECCMGTSMFAYLNGYQDPRLAVYFTEARPVEEGKDIPAWSVDGYNGKKYAPVPPGTANGAKTFAGASIPNFTSTTPTYWMRTSEVYFLLAEASLEWSEFGSASDWYRKGIEMSFEENGLSASLVNSYINNVNTPSDVKVSNINYSASAPTQTTTQFSSNKETALEQIMIQKWIALYPNGMEAWTEWRKTGYPKLNQVHVNNGAAVGVTKASGIRRMVYPNSFSQSTEDRANYEEALQKLGGQDSPTTKLWWDCK
ncbi:MAG: SusD/RagB family nutrient-binding outer membrane lipoprotein [Clostridium sp.]|nr:SusD/RagB family nutrient-binding outer membrane lipoprotein [Bacteroides sp.]MCM1198655.1 SusD/RagB family nutrient-binding outer membrane lipoprotein [Clostridium sp.]